MSSKYCEMDIVLNELTCKAEIMKESLQKSLLIKTKYIQLNEESRKRIQRLLISKEHYEYIKDMLLKDWYGTSVNAGKRKILLTHRVQEFHKRNETFKSQLENLPSISQQKELIQSNLNLNCEYLKCCEKLEMVKKEHSKLQYDIENNLMKKIIEFSHEFLKTRKQDENDKSSKLNLT